jgi:hypothetical protein
MSSLYMHFECKFQNTAIIRPSFFAQRYNTKVFCIFPCETSPSKMDVHTFIRTRIGEETKEEIVESRLSLLDSAGILAV